MAGWSVPRRGGALEDTDGASRFLSGRYKRYGAGPLDLSAWPGPMIMPLEVAACSPCPVDSFMGYRLLFPELC